MTTAAATRIVVLGAKRTAMGGFGGSFKDLTATELCSAAIRAALAHARVPAARVRTVIAGNVAQTSTMAPYLARHAALAADVPIETPALTVNRLCGSGFQSIINASHELLLGEADVAVAAGTESMSQAPFAVRNTRFGTALGTDYKFEDTLWATLTDGYIKTPMGVTAENLAEKYGISRADTDAYALQSQQRWKAASDAGVFAAETAGIDVKVKRKTVTVTVDEHPRPQTTAESLAKLPAVFKKDGVTTAGNASGISDGAGALVLATEAWATSDEAQALGVAPLARVVAWHVSGVDPHVMGIGPVPAIQGVLAKSGLTLADVERVEVNEAFAAQYLAVEKELGLERAKTNVNGGAIALGHPLAASGSRIMAHLVHDMAARADSRKSPYSIGSACIGGGQGIAVLLESL